MRALVGGVALLVVFQWYGPGGYSHMKTGQHDKKEQAAEQVSPEVEKPVFGPYEVYGPFKKGAG